MHTLNIATYLCTSQKGWPWAPPAVPCRVLLPRCKQHKLNTTTQTAAAEHSDARPQKRRTCSMPLTLHSTPSPGLMLEAPPAMHSKTLASLSTFQQNVHNLQGWPHICSPCCLTYMQAAGNDEMS
jgi:hypothetical protein